MNLFNRIGIILSCLALAAAVISIAALAWTMPDESLDGLRDAIDWLDRNDGDGERALLTAGGVFLAGIALALALIELLPQTGTEVKVTDLRVGDAVLSTLAISQRVEEAVTQVPHVADVRAAVKGKRKGVKLALDLHVDPDANLADVTDAACQAAENVLKERVHVVLAEPPKVRLHYRELRLRGKPALRPMTAVAVAAGAATGGGEPLETTVGVNEPADRAEAAPKNAKPKAEASEEPTEE
jgi:hypothetical protein